MARVLKGRRTKSPTLNDNPRKFTMYENHFFGLLHVSKGSILFDSPSEGIYIAFGSDLLQECRQRLQAEGWIPVEAFSHGWLFAKPKNKA